MQPRSALHNTLSYYSATYGSCRGKEGDVSGQQDPPDPFPDARMAPAMVTPCYRGPRTKPFGQGAPGATGAHDPQDPFHHKPAITRRTTAPRPRQQRVDLGPEGRGQLR